MTAEPAKDRREPEVTPEMVEAALMVLEGHYLGDDHYDLSGAVISEVYRAMDRYRQ